VALAFASEDIPERFDGYGYLVTKAENMATLGVLKESSIFDGRTDSRHVLLRIMLGGARRPEVAALDENALVERARVELGSVLGVHAKPLKTWVARWEKGIPQYTLGHLQRVATARHRVAHYPRLALCGSSYDGVAFDAAVSSGRDRARELLRNVAGDARLEPSRPGPPPGQAEHAVRAAS
jgi:oxygen-dependent protoporphyrinogen oxidase